MPEGEALVAAAAEPNVIESAAFWWQSSMALVGLPFLIGWLRARRGGTDPAPAGDPPVLRWGWVATIAAVMAWLVTLVTAFGVAAAAGHRPDAMGLPGQLAIVGLAGAVGLGVGYGVLRGMDRWSATPPRRSAPARRAAAHGVLRALAFQPVAYASYWATVVLFSLLGQEVAPQGLVLEGLSGDVSMFWLIAGFAVVMAPVLEEGFFRGLVLGALRRFRGPQLAIVTSAILFGIVHTEGSNLIAVPTTLILGLFLGGLRERTGGLAAPVAMHATHNGLAMLGLFIARTWG